MKPWGRLLRLGHDVMGDPEDGDGGVTCMGTVSWSKRGEPQGSVIGRRGNPRAGMVMAGDPVVPNARAKAG